MLTKQDLKKLTRDELEDAILKYPAMHHTLFYVLKRKEDAVHASYDEKIKSLSKKKDDYLAEKKRKYGTSAYEETIRKFTVDERFEYLKIINALNKAYDEDSKLYGKEYEEFKRRWRK